MPLKSVAIFHLLTGSELQSTGVNFGVLFFNLNISHIKWRALPTEGICSGHSSWAYCSIIVLNHHS